MTFGGLRETQGEAIRRISHERMVQWRDELQAENARIVRGVNDVIDAIGDQELVNGQTVVRLLRAFVPERS